MFSVLLMGIVLAVCIWGIFKIMYPRPPGGYYQPKPGESTEPRQCNYCGHTLAEWRGIVDGDKFFCNPEHQADFYAGKTYRRVDGH